MERAASPASPRPGRLLVAPALAGLTLPPPAAWPWPAWLALLAAYGFLVALVALRVSARRRRGCEGSPEDPHKAAAAPEPRGPCKLMLLVRTDLGMGKGKMCAQCGHAAVAAVLDGRETHPGYVSSWLRRGQAKIAVKVTGEQLEQALAAAEAAGLPCGAVQDAGRTQVEPGSVTVGYVGPCPVEAVDPITGGYPLL